MENIGRKIYHDIKSDFQAIIIVGEIFSRIFAVVFLGPVVVCENHDCKNGGTCAIVNNKVKCVCLHGYRGDHCEGITKSYGSVVDNCVNKDTTSI